MKMVKFAALLAATVVAGSANAAISTYTDLGSFNAAAGATTLVDFNSSPDGSFDGTTYDVGPFSLTGLPTNGYGNMAVASSQVNANVCGSAVCGTPFGYTVTFDAPVTSFAFDLSGITGSGLTFTVGSDVFALPFQNGFFGFVNSNPFTSIVVSGENEIHFFDNVRFGTGNAVPEPATWAMMIGGFALAGAAMRRRKAVVSFA